MSFTTDKNASKNPKYHHVFVALESAKWNSENAPNAHIAVSIKCMLKCGRHFYVSGAGCY